MKSSVERQELTRIRENCLALSAQRSNLTHEQPGLVLKRAKSYEDYIINGFEAPKKVKSKTAIKVPKFKRA